MPVFNFCNGSYVVDFLVLICIELYRIFEDVIKWVRGIYTINYSMKIEPSKISLISQYDHVIILQQRIPI